MSHKTNLFSTLFKQTFTSAEKRQLCLKPANDLPNGLWRTEFGRVMRFSWTHREALLLMHVLTDFT